MPELASVVASLEGFDWDAGNSEKNWRRHRVTQSECEQVFGNLPLLVSVAGEAGSREDRYFALGRTNTGRALTIVFTVRGKKVRVISARPMSRRERKEYERAYVAATKEDGEGS